MCQQLLKWATAVAVVVNLSGCAGVDIYTERLITPNTPKTGIPVYGSKPYLLVARTDAKDKPVEVSIIHLPDTQNVVYAVPRSGFGSAKTTLGLANGQLTSFGQETDTKVAELLTSIGGIITARGAADKAHAEADVARHGILQSATDTTKVVIAVQTVVNEIKSHRKDKKSVISVLSDTQKAKVDEIVKTLQADVDGLKNLAFTATAAERIASIKAQADELEKLEAGDGLPPPRLAAQALLRQWATDLRSVVKPVEQPEPVKPSFELYEIQQNSTGVRLVPVTVPMEKINPAAVVNSIQGK